MKKALILIPMLLALLVTPSAMATVKGDQEQVDPDITNGTAAREFRQAREKWLDLGISDYRMTVSRGCFCPQPFQVTVTVRSGKPVKVSDRPWYGPFTVPGMFRIVGEAIKRPVAILDVNYASRFGFPKKTSIDYIAMAVDDEISYEISKFKKLKP